MIRNVQLKDAEEIAVSPKDLRQRGNAGLDPFEASRPVVNGIASGHPDGAGGLADGDGDVGAVEQDSLGREFVDVGTNARYVTAGDAEGVVVHVVDGDEEDVPFV